MPFKGSVGLGFPIGESLRTKLITVVTGTTRCITNPGYELTSGSSDTSGVSPTNTTVNITSSVAAEDSLRKYTDLEVTSVSLLASTMHTIPNISDTIDVNNVPQKVI